MINQCESAKQKGDPTSSAKLKHLKNKISEYNTYITTDIQQHTHDQFKVTILSLRSEPGRWNIWA